MNTVNLSVELVNAVLNYLGSKPFMEVAGLIQKIQEEAGPQVPPPAADENAASE